LSNVNNPTIVQRGIDGYFISQITNQWGSFEMSIRWSQRIQKFDNITWLCQAVSFVCQFKRGL